MARGHLRVYLGSAPGAGKTYRMLDEGWRRRQRGTDVVIGFVETHGRAQTIAQIRDLEIVPRTSLDYRDTHFEEMDVPAVLARHPAVALVDELAHSNAPGSPREKRWQDVEILLDAGIDVITTLNIQHLESLNDVVEKITGIVQRETVPDIVVRQADQIELVDITPEALRRRMAHGNIYAADKIDVALSNYFREGNLTALRELALLWLADRVEVSLQHYQSDHDIAATWETRERLIVGITGTSADEVLIRRAARMASRTGGDLIAVYVHATDAPRLGADHLTATRHLLDEVGGRLEEIVNDDVGAALVAFARAERATQVILGASRPRRGRRSTSGIVERVLRDVRDLDVHVIATGATAPRSGRRSPRSPSPSWRRRTVAGLGAVVALPIITALMAAGRASLSQSTIFLAYLVVVLAVAAEGGVVVGALAALAAAGLENFYFVAPLHTLEVARPDNVVALVGFLVFAATASGLVTRLTRRSANAERARAEVAILSRTSDDLASSHEDVRPLLDAMRAVFSFVGLALLARHEGDWDAVVVSGESPVGVAGSSTLNLDADFRLVLSEEPRDAGDQALITAFARRLVHELRRRESLRDAEDLGELATAYRRLATTVRLTTTVLSRLSARLRDDALPRSTTRARPRDPSRPSTTGEPPVAVPEDLDDLILLGRIAGGLTETTATPAPLSEVLDALTRDTALPEGRLVVDVAPTLPPILVDGELAARVLGIIVRRALRCDAGSAPVLVRAGPTATSVDVMIVDQGPRATPTQRDLFARGVLDTSGGECDLVPLELARFLLQDHPATLALDDTPGHGVTVTVRFTRSGG